MSCDRQENPDETCKILQFRSHADAHEPRPEKDPERDIDRLIDLSRYEKPAGDESEYRARMVENMAAVALLSVLVAIAAYDVVSLEQIQHCVAAGPC